MSETDLRTHAEEIHEQFSDQLDLTVDDALIGGLVVRVGSQMIDTSIRAKLNALQNTMKEVR